MFVSTILAKSRHPVPTLRSDATILEAAQALNENCYGALLVTDNGRDILGIVTARELWRAELSYGGIISSSHFMDRSVGEVMTRNVITCTIHETLLLVSERMTQHRISQLPVVHDDGICGIITRRDLLDDALDNLNSDSESDQLDSSPV